jgi:2-hydroxychromene-2-carboxylate isomerase
MKHITFYFDFISPYAYLAFERLPLALKGLSYHVTYKPVLFAAMLDHHGQKGPAEISPKRTWTYRQMQWLAREHQIPLLLPASHPFNPIALLRLALACGDHEACNRYVAEHIFRHVWCSGLEAADAVRFDALAMHLQPKRLVSDAAVKAQLRANTQAALDAGVFGVPSMQTDGEMFWGLDALPMLRQCLEDDPWYLQSEWQNAGGLPVGIRRKIT